MDDDTTSTDDQGLGPKSGRVRIIGAEPATQSLDPPPEGGVADDGPAGAEEAPEPTAGTLDGPPPEPGLPHWTEAPTGEVPAVLARDRGDESDPWANVPGPTWREEHHDWTAAEDTFEPSMLAGDDDLRRGSLTESDAADSDRQPWTFDLTSPGPEDEEFTAGGIPASAIDQYPDDQTMVIPAVPAASGPVADAAPAAPADQWADPAPVVVPDVDDGVVATYAGAPDESAEPAIGPPAEAPEPRGRRGRTGSTRPLRRRSRSAASDEAAVAAENPVDSLLGVSDPAGTATAGAAAVAASSSGPIPVSTSRPARSQPPVRHRPPPPTDGERSDRNMPLAVATGVVLIILALVVFDLGTVLTMALATVLVVIAAAEAYAATRRAGYHPATLLALVATLSLMVGTYNKGVEALPLVVILLVAFSVLWFSWVEKVDAVRNTGATLFVFGWIAVFGSYAALLLNPTLFPDRHGIAFVLAAVITAAAYDIGALFVGRWVGRHPLAPTISPGKTWEGAIGGAVAAILAAVIIVHFIHPWTMSKAFALGVVVAVVAPLGDLFESVFKRTLGLKDMSRILPGHGGLLDRVDGLLFVLPATYYLVKAVHLG
jgi:CDP-diglyceride synthetase